MGRIDSRHRHQPGDVGEGLARVVLSVGAAGNARGRPTAMVQCARARVILAAWSVSRAVLHVVVIEYVPAVQRKHAYVNRDFTPALAAGGESQG